MNEHHEFDELARRKLAEREHVFQEDDWLAAQRVIQADRPAFGGMRTIRIVSALAAVGVASWLFWPSSKEAENEEPWVAVVPTTGAPKTEAATKATPGDVPEAASAPHSAFRVSKEPKQAGPTTTATPVTDEVKSKVVQDEYTKSAEVQITDATPYQSSALEIDKGTGEASNANEPDDHGVVINEQHEQVIRVSNKDRSDEGPTLEQGATSSSLNEDPIQATELNGRADDHAAASDGSSTGNHPVFTPSAEQQRNISDSTVVAGSSTADTTLQTRPAATAQDSATNAPAPVIVPPVPAASRWELSALGGGMRSSSTYTGGTSELWRDGSTGRRSLAFGAEIMHRGRNFSFGGGVHHVTYAEDLDVASRSVTNMTTRDTNFFQAVDTTLLIVVGTTQINGQTYYITEQFNATMQVLVSGTATSITTQELLRAMKATNRVSYLEIPLLADAHLDQGPWSLGVRGGPTLGILTSRRGALPRTSFDGPLSDPGSTFKRTLFGVTGRAYIRYRFTTGWSVGLEPTWRMQVGNVLDSGEIVRRNAGLGGYLSLTYQLR